MPCYNPRYIDNLYFRQEPPVGFAAAGWRARLHAFADDRFSRIPVPCGHCKCCLSNRSSYVAQRIIEESNESWTYMLMLSYDDKHLPSLVIGDEEFSFADFGHISAAMHHFRNSDLFKEIVVNSGRVFKYFVVSERGSKKGRPHFHMLLHFERRKDDDYLYWQFNVLNLVKNWWKVNWATNVGTRKCPVWQPLYTYAEKRVNGILYRNFDCKFVDTLNDQKYAFYISKYLFKNSSYAKRMFKVLYRVYTCDFCANLPTDVLGYPPLSFRQWIQSEFPRGLLGGFVSSKFYGFPRLHVGFPADLPRTATDIYLDIDPIKQDFVSKFERLFLAGSAMDTYQLPVYRDKYLSVQLPLAPYYKRYFSGKAKRVLMLKNIALSDAHPYTSRDFHRFGEDCHFEDFVNILDVNDT